MNLVKWSSELELGIPEIDSQHKKLVDLLNEFYTHLEKGEKKEGVERFLNELEDYLNFHLDYEEEFLKKIGFPELEGHQKLHNMFKKLYKEEKERFLKGDEKALRELVAFTFSWLYSHIMKSDKKYAKFLREGKL